ncbi:cell division inhibition protein DicB, partial [Escherichia coli]|nr:cell division inhibition protein DicB [Escherichia coli]HCR5497979.1 cell division inhibition protein DicB [Shigella sonnei]EFB2844598.1 cell division inhibition protein DicB [Escherichia coli]EHC4945948.1 cell division inhibition protein DicB [Escherichia coli]EHD0924594.1 cell division inhibition protein DicB [Escherichia coli]
SMLARLRLMPKGCAQ